MSEDNNNDLEENLKINNLDNITDKSESFNDKTVKCHRCGGDLMLGITYFGRIVLTLYTFHGLFFLYNIIFQYIILFGGILYDINYRLFQILFSMIYILFSISAANILVIPTYEFLTFPFLSYRNPFLHLMSFTYIMKNVKFNTDIAIKKNSNLVNIILIFIEIVYTIGLLSSYLSISSVIKDYTKIVILYFIYSYYLTLLFSYFFIFIYLFYRLILHSSEKYNKNNNDKNIKHSRLKKYLIILKDSFDVDAFFSEREELPDINLLSYIINPFLMKNYEFKNGKQFKKKHMEDYCDTIGFYQRAILLILSIILLLIFIISYKEKITVLSLTAFIFLFLALSTLSIGLNFPFCFRNKKTFGNFFAATNYRYKYKMRHPIMISLVRFISNVLVEIICIALIYVFFFMKDTKDIESIDFIKKSNLNTINMTDFNQYNRDLLLPSVCFSSVHNIPISLFLPFIIDAYYNEDNNKNTSISSLDILQYKNLFYSEDYEIKNYGDLVKHFSKDNSTVRMIHYNVKNKKEELTILSIKGTSYKKDIFIDIQLYFPSVLLNILTTFSLSQKGDQSSKLIETSFNLPFRIFFNFLIIDDYLALLLKAYSENVYNFHKTVVIVGHSLGGGLAKILGRFLKKQAISLSGPGMNAFNSLFEFGGKNENFGISNIDLIPDMDLVPRVEVSGGTIYRLVCDAGAFACHSSTRSLCEILVMCRHPNYKEYCLKIADIDEEKIKRIEKLSELNDY